MRFLAIWVQGLGPDKMISMSSPLQDKIHKAEAFPVFFSHLDEIIQEISTTISQSRQGTAIH